MGKRKRWMLLAVILVAACVSIASIVWFYPRERLLLAQAVPLTDTTGWGAAQETLYYWLPDQSLLLLRYIDRSGDAATTYKASHYDLAAHRETPLPGLTS